jgi:hypothetical protein
MPKDPNGYKRPADVIGNAVRIMQIATGEIDEPALDTSTKNAKAVERGRRGGVKGGKARAEKLSPRKRTAIARKAAAARWNFGKKTV